MSCGWIGLKCDLSLFSLSAPNSSCHPLPCYTTSISSLYPSIFHSFKLSILFFPPFTFNFQFINLCMSSLPCPLHFNLLYFPWPLSVTCMRMDSSVKHQWSIPALRLFFLPHRPLVVLISNHSPSASWKSRCWNHFYFCQGNVLDGYLCQSCYSVREDETPREHLCKRKVQN